MSENPGPKCVNHVSQPTKTWTSVPKDLEGGNRSVHPRPAPVPGFSETLSQFQIRAPTSWAAGTCAGRPLQLASVLGPPETTCTASREEGVHLLHSHHGAAAANWPQQDPILLLQASLCAGPLSAHQALHTDPRGKRVP